MERASNMKFGVIAVREFSEHIAEHLPLLVDSFIDMGCHHENVVIKHVPTLQDIVVATQFMAQYTDVDGVVILAPKNRAMGMLSLMNGIVQLQIQWTMVVEIGGVECAGDIVSMINLQNEMELDSQDLVNPRLDIS